MKIKKYEYENLVRDSERLSIINAVVADYEHLDKQLLRILCGLQTKGVPDIRPTEPAIMIDAVEDPGQEQLEERLNDFF